MDAELLLVQPYLLEEETGSSPCPGAEAAGGHGPPWSYCRHLLPYLLHDEAVTPDVAGDMRELDAHTKHARN